MKLKSTVIISIFLISWSACVQTKNNLSSEQGKSDNKEVETRVSTLQYKMIVASKKTTCQTMILQDCLLVRTNAESPWENFSSPIEGFNYKEGYEYNIEVKRSTRKKIPADASAYRYELVQIINKKKKRL